MIEGRFKLALLFSLRHHNQPASTHFHLQLASAEEAKQVRG